MSPGELVDVSFGLLGVQIVWGLQNVNTTRIFQSLGAGVSDLPILWIAAPITGLLVQPIVGYLSDRTRGRFGRRRPYLAAGAALSALALIGMAEATTLWSAIMALWVLTAAVNIAMQPLRSLMADLLPPEQRTAGFAAQVVFIGAGAVFASALPWMLVTWFGVAGVGEGGVSRVVQLAFRIGAVGLLLSVGWTVLRVREPRGGPVAPAIGVVLDAPRTAAVPTQRAGIAWTIAGAAVGVFAASQGLRREIYLVAALAFAFGVARCLVVAGHRRGKAAAGLLEIVEDAILMPPLLRRLAWVQFFTWFGLFALWVYAVPAVAARHYGTSDAASRGYEAAANWVGLLFAIYDGVAIVVALALPWIAGRLGLRRSHALCLGLGAAGLAGMVVLREPQLLWIASLGIGCAWASILSTPYAMIAEAAPADKVGVHMGIHNIFLVLPQLVAASVLGAVMDRVFAGDARSMLALATGAVALAAGLSLLILPASSHRR